MKRIEWIVLSVLLQFCIYGQANADTQRFIVVGNGVIFALPEPTGWKMDTNSTKHDNLPVVYYPAGQTWSNAPAVMYVNSSINDCHTSFEQFITNDLANFKRNSPAIVIKDEGTMTADGKKVVIKRFNGDQHGNSEAVAYLDNTDGAFITITLTSRTQPLFDNALPVFKELVSNFQLVGNAVTCNRKSPSSSERVERDRMR